jgi:hypothetical protein
MIAVPCASQIFAWRLRGWGRWKGGRVMANTATLADVKLVLSAPVRIKTKRSGYGAND